MLNSPPPNFICLNFILFCAAMCPGTYSIGQAGLVLSDPPRLPPECWEGIPHHYWSKIYLLDT